MTDNMNQSRTAPGIGQSDGSVLKAKLTCLDETVLPKDQRNMIFQLLGLELIVGRGSDAGIILNSNQISRKHARLYPQNETWRVQDLKSTNGVSVNKESITDVQLHSGDFVSFGPIVFRFDVLQQIREDSAPEKTLFGSIDEPPEDATMMFTDVRSGRAMMDALEKKKENQELLNEVEGMQDIHAKENHQGRSSASSGLMAALLKWLCVLVFITVFIGGLVYYYNNVFLLGLAKEALLAKYESSVEMFITENRSSGRYSEKLYINELESLQKIQQDLQSAIVEYPEIIELKKLEIDIIFMKLVRQVRFLYEQNEAEKSHNLITSSKAQFVKYLGKQGGGGELEKTVKTVVNLSRLLQIVSIYKNFEQLFPDPHALHVDELPAHFQQEIASLKEMRHEYTDLRKRNNLALSVRFRYLDGMLNDVEHVLLLVNKWHDMVIAPET